MAPLWRSRLDSQGGRVTLRRLSGQHGRSTSNLALSPSSPLISSLLHHERRSSSMMRKSQNQHRSVTTLCWKPCTMRIDGQTSKRYLFVPDERASSTLLNPRWFLVVSWYLRWAYFKDRRPSYFCDSNLLIQVRTNCSNSCSCYVKGKLHGFDRRLTILTKEFGLTK